MFSDACRGVRAVGVMVGAVLIAVAATGCEIVGSARPAPAPTVLPRESPPPVTPPRTLAELVNHQCTVLTPQELSRFGFESPGEAEPSNSYCRWRTPATGVEQFAMYFAPDPWRKYQPVEDAHRGTLHFRELTIARRPAFLLDEHRERAHTNCRIWVSVSSGGLFEFEYAPQGHGVEWNLCARAIEVATVIAERIQ